VDRPAAEIDDERTRRGEERDRKHDPHGVGPAKQAAEDEPLAWPSSDRQQMETTTHRVEQDEPAPQGEPDVRPPLGNGLVDVPPVPTGEGQMALPVPGYPYSAEALTDWFSRTYSRDPSVAELGALMNAMAQRDSTPPHDGPEADPHGWQTTPSTARAARR
jgi:hypothetical protein